MGISIGLTSSYSVQVRMRSLGLETMDCEMEKWTAS
jgi:hypothetical protein